MHWQADSLPAEPPEKPEASLDSGKKKIKTMDAYTYMAESLCCEPETITTLLIGYTPLCNEN